MDAREFISELKPQLNRRLAAVPCGMRSADGRRFYSIPVRVRCSGVNREFWQHEAFAIVIAESPAAAANWVKDLLAPVAEYPVEIDAFGPKGGAVGRFIGWESLIGAKLFQDRPQAVQLGLPSILDSRSEKGRLSI